MVLPSNNLIEKSMQVTSALLKGRRMAKGLHYPISSCLIRQEVNYYRHTLRSQTEAVCTCPMACTGYV